MLYADVISFFAAKKCQKKLMKIVNIEEENLHISWTTSGNPIKFLGKMCLMIIIKVTENEDFTHSLKNPFLEKPQEGQIESSQPFND